jgi:hypothetical protein
MSDQLALSACPTTTSDYVEVNLPLLLSTPSIDFPGTFEQRLVTVRRRGKNLPSLKFDLDHLQAICEQEAARAGEYTVEIDRSDREAAINLTFRPAMPEEKTAARERALKLANALIDVLYAACQ